MFKLFNLYVLFGFPHEYFVCSFMSPSHFDVPNTVPVTAYSNEYRLFSLMFVTLSLRNSLPSPQHSVIEQSLTPLEISSVVILPGP
jgi:hypothetical protein